MGELLVTGFGSFPGVRINPTAEFAIRVAARLCQRGFGARAIVLPTSYSEGLPLLETVIARDRPAAVLMLGLAARARAIRVERFARPGASRLHPDAGGNVAHSMSAAAPRVLLTARGDIHVALACLTRGGLRVRLSHSAGRYLCNAGYYDALRHPALKGRPVIFIHIPWPRGAKPGRWRPDPARLCARLSDIGRALAVQARRAEMAQG